MPQQESIDSPAIYPGSSYLEIQNKLTAKAKELLARWTFFLDEPQFFVYIMTNASHVSLYVGRTKYPHRRPMEHKWGIYPNAYTKKYKINQLVWMIGVTSLDEAVDLEYRFKRWHREWKEALINAVNPNWDDLASYEVNKTPDNHAEEGMVSEDRRFC
jgi:putative endonuclease